MAAGSVGTSVPRVDGIDKVTGRARFVDDLSLPGMLWGATVRTALPAGTLTAILRDESFDWSEVVYADASAIQGDNAILLMETDQPALVPIGGEVRHAEEPVALVAARSPELAARAAAAVRIEIDEKRAVLDIEAALKADVLLRGHDNVFKRYQINKGGDVEAELAASHLVIEGVYRTPAQEQMYIEPQGVLAHWPAADRCHVIGSLQCPFYVRKALERLLDLPEDGVVVEQATTGGGFGGKEEFPSMVAAHATLLARAAGRPVKIIYDREEDIASTTKRHPSRVTHRLGLNSDGTIRAIDVDVVLDGGAYITLSPVVLSRAVLHAAGPYRCETTRVRGRVVATNTPPHGAFRGFGAPQVTFAYERQMQKAARALGIDAMTLRRKNALRAGEATSTSQILADDVGSDAVLDAVANAVSGCPVAPGLAAGPQTPAVRRGRGLAFYFHGAGFTGSGEERLAGQAQVALVEGGRFEVRAGSTDIGQGARTTLAQIAADALGVDVALVSTPQPRTDRVPDSGPTVASRTCMVVGGLAKRAGQALREKLLARARELGHTGELTAAVARRLADAGGELAETVTYSPPPGIRWDDDTYTGSAYPTYGWAACLVDVAVMMDTYEVVVERCVHAVDVGKAINPVIVKGQIEGGTMQAIGWALLEEVQYRGGRVANRRMTNCIIPTFADAPEMTTLIVEKAYGYGPHGAKGVGELPMDGPAAAVVGAIEDALGVAIDSLPACPEAIARHLDYPEVDR